MNIQWTFPKQVLLTLIIVGSVGAYLLTKYGSREILDSAIVGTVLATVNVLLGYAAIEYSFGKSATTFLKYVLGGMGIRMFMMAGLLVLLFNVFGFHILALVTALGIFYIIFLVLEIIYIQKKFSIKQQL